MERVMMVPRLADAKEAFLLKPLVETQCEKVDHSTPANLLFPSNKLWTPPGTTYEGVHWPIPNGSWELFPNTTHDSAYLNFKWVDLQTYLSHPSIGTVITTPAAIVNESGWFQDSNVYACSINARWIPVDLRFDPLCAAVRMPIPQSQCQIFLDTTFQTSPGRFSHSFLLIRRGARLLTKFSIPQTTFFQAR